MADDFAKKAFEDAIRRVNGKFEAFDREFQGGIAKVLRAWEQESLKENEAETLEMLISLSKNPTTAKRLMQIWFLYGAICAVNNPDIADGVVSAFGLNNQKD